MSPPVYHQQPNYQHQQAWPLTPQQPNPYAQNPVHPPYQSQHQQQLGQTQPQYHHQHPQPATQNPFDPSPSPAKPYLQSQSNLQTYPGLTTPNPTTTGSNPSISTSMDFEAMLAQQTLQQQQAHRQPAPAYPQPQQHRPQRDLELQQLQTTLAELTEKVQAGDDEVNDLQKQVGTLHKKHTRLLQELDTAKNAASQGDARREEKEKLEKEKEKLNKDLSSTLV